MSQGTSIAAQTPPELITKSFSQLNSLLYKLPSVSLPSPLQLTINGPTAEIIDYNRFSTLSSSDQVGSVDVNPFLQPWAGAPGTPNKILTVIDKNNNVYIVLIKIVEGKAFPPDPQ